MNGIEVTIVFLACLVTLVVIGVFATRGDRPRRAQCTVCKQGEGNDCRHFIAK